MVLARKRFKGLSMSDQHRAANNILNDLGIDGESARIRFAPEVVKAFAHIEAAVRNSERFDRDRLINLQELAAGKDYTVRAAITNVGLIAQEVTEQVNATGNKKAKLALGELFDVLSGMEEPLKPVTGVASKQRAR